jgi:ABC-type amino acid transport substrate-binding protein
MGYQNPRTGRIDGFETDLARALGEKLFGASDHIELAQVTDDKHIEMLQADVVDVVLSQFTITPDPAEQVDFSIPYWVTREGVLVRKGSGIKGFDDRIAVTAGLISLRRMRATPPEGDRRPDDRESCIARQAVRVIGDIVKAIPRSRRAQPHPA